MQKKTRSLVCAVGIVLGGYPGIPSRDTVAERGISTDLSPSLSPGPLGISAPPPLLGVTWLGGHSP